MPQRAVLAGCIVVGAVTGVLLLLRAEGMTTSPLTIGQVRETFRLVAIFVYGIFGALSGWTVATVALYLISTGRRRDE